MENTPVAIDAAHVIAALREQLADAHWQITLLRAEIAQATAQLPTPDADTDTPTPDTDTPPEA